MTDSINYFHSVFNTPPKWSSHLSSLCLSSLSSQLAHTENQFLCLSCKEWWFVHNWSWPLSETGHWQRGPEGPFVTSALVLLSWQADNFIREVSQGESINGSCAYEEQMHFKKSCWRAWNALIWRWKTPKQEGFGPFWVWLTLWFLWAVIPRAKINAEMVFWDHSCGGEHGEFQWKSSWIVKFRSYKSKGHERSNIVSWNFTVFI